MEKEKWLAEQFEAHRDHLQRVAYRMLGSTRRGRRCRAGGLAAAQPRRRRRHRQSRRLADHGGGARLPRHACGRASRGARSRWTASRSPPPSISAQPIPSARPSLPTIVGLALLVVLRGAGAGRAGGLRAARHVRPAVRGDRAHRRPLADGGAAARQPRAAPRAAARPKTSEADVASHRKVVDAFLAAAAQRRYGRRCSPCSIRTSCCAPIRAAVRLGRHRGTARRRGRGRQLQGQGAAARGPRWSMARWASSWRRRAGCCWCST